MLVISVEGLRRLQRNLDRWLRTRRSNTDEELSSQTQNLLGRSEKRWLKSRNMIMVEQGLRGVIHGIQFLISYVIMMLFMYSNGMLGCEERDN